jgi:hypothetical protein
MDILHNFWDLHTPFVNVFFITSFSSSFTLFVPLDFVGTTTGLCISAVSLDKSKVSEVLLKDFGYELGPARCTLHISDRKAAIRIASNRPLKQFIGDSDE